jgi:glycerate 2-kinase
VKDKAQQIFRETLAAIDIGAAMGKRVVPDGPRLQCAGEAIDLHDFRKIFAIALGKASYAMADGLSHILEPEIQLAGILVCPTKPPRDLPGWRTFVGGHPVPNEESFASGRAILQLLRSSNERTLVFFLISGGGSALVDLPLDSSVTLEEFQRLHSALVTCGAPIEEINVVRKHLSATKGGRLAAAAPQSLKLTLAISDVPPGQESALASGPTLPDPSTVEDVERIIQRYGLGQQLPAAIRKALDDGRLEESPKAGDDAFARAHFDLLLGEHDLLHAAHRACEAEGFMCLCDHSTDNWPIEKAANHLLALLDGQKKANSGRPVAVVADGEVSSRVTGDGVGGRNSAFVLACARRIAGRNISVLSAGTDGIDGNSPAAGAVADGETLSRAQVAGLDPEDHFRRSDAYHFFAALDDAILTGPTGNNLRDLRILLSA